MEINRVITHTALTLLGWLFISMVEENANDKSSPSTPVDVTHRSNTKPQSKRSTSLATPGDILAVLAEKPMEAHVRMALKDRIINNWVNDDPLGFLNHFSDRGWPDHRNWQIVSNAFHLLAKNNPEQLLNYARETGCLVAIRTLAQSGDPHAVFHLFNNEKYTIPAQYFHTLFESGTGKDPHFHKLVSHIKNQEAFTQAFIGAGNTLLKLNRHETYLTLITDNQHNLDPRSVAYPFCESILGSRKDPKLILSLPETFHNTAIDSALYHAQTGYHLSDSYRRDLLDMAIKKQRIMPHVKEANKIIKIDTWSRYNQERGARMWHDWALTLPRDDGLRQLQHTAIRRWIITLPSDWQKISQLPNQELKDISYTAAVSSIDLEKDLKTAQWMTQQISDKHLQKAAIEAISYRLDNKDDPTADGIDPYDPLNTYGSAE